ncbi:hypothetical protein ACHAPU_010303 [Fusarium lateritium]
MAPTFTDYYVVSNYTSLYNGLLTPYYRVTEEDAKRYYNASTLVQGQYRTTSSNWSEFCQWWQMPQHVFTVVTIAFLPLFIILYCCLKGRKLGWDWSNPFGFFKKEAKEEPVPIHEPEYDLPEYTAQPGLTDWNQLYPLPSTTSMERSREPTPRKGMALGAQSNYSASPSTPYGNPYSGSSYELQESQSISATGVIYPLPESDVDASSTIAYPATPQPSQTSRQDSRDLSAFMRPLSPSFEAPPAYE